MNARQVGKYLCQRFGARHCSAIVWATTTGAGPEQRRSPGGTAVYEDTQWSPDQDLQLLKSNIPSQKKQIVAANMNLTDAEAETAT